MATARSARWRVDGKRVRGLLVRASPRDARSTSAFDDQRALRRWDIFHRPRFVLQVHGMRGRRGGDGVLVGDLLMTIAIEQHAERVKTGNYSPQLDAVAQEDRDRRSLALQVLEERVLKAMNVVVGHLLHSSWLSGTFGQGGQRTVPPATDGRRLRRSRADAGLRRVAPRDGFEPSTNRLTAGCSTAELPGTTAARAGARL